MRSKKERPSLIQLLQAINHPYRLRALGVMARKPASATTLARMWGDVKVNKISYHLKSLREAKVLEITSVHPVRGVSETFYRLKSSAFRGVVDWSDLTPQVAGFLQELSASTFLSALRDAAEAGELTSEDSGASWQSVRVDEKGQAELKALVVELLAALPEIEKRSAKRAKSHGAPLVTALVGAATFPVIESKP